MKKKLYDLIVVDIHHFSGLSRDCAEMLIQKYPNVPAESLHSILSIEVIHQAKMSRNKLYGFRYNHLEQYKKFLQKGDPPGIILRQAAALKLPPALLARVILEKFYHDEDEQGATSKSDIHQLMKDPSLIKDLNLSYEVYLCILYDDRNGRISNTFSFAIGYKYEVKLQKLLEEHKILFSTEEELRRRGYDKTPDIKLEIPIAVDGFIVNWIESKARFGSPAIHNDLVKQQYLSYWNRFGPGLVLYWFDFVDEIIEPSEKKFIVMNHFPKNITFMNPELT